MNRDSRSPLWDRQMLQFLLIEAGIMLVVFAADIAERIVPFPLSAWWLPGALLLFLAAVFFTVVGWRLTSGRPQPRPAFVVLCFLPAILSMALTYALFDVDGGGSCAPLAGSVLNMAIIVGVGNAMSRS